MAVDATAVAKQLGYGRLAIGAVMVAVPGLVSKPWVGSGDAAATVPTRALGAREVLLGFLAAHTADRPGVGARTIRSVALLDAVDVVTTLAARRDVPALGVASVVAMAGPACLAGLWASSKLPG